MISVNLKMKLNLNVSSGLQSPRKVTQPKQLQYHLGSTLQFGLEKTQIMIAQVSTKLKKEKSKSRLATVLRPHLTLHILGLHHSCIREFRKGQ
jgi:hypothetical protein